jgi:antitoxin (DNA-binding transcriptional repressor) of toxin-antitoxin stability system
MMESMTQVRMTETELARDVHGALEKVRQGAEVVIEQDHRPVAVIKTLPGPGRMLSECIAIAKQREKERGYAVTLDPDFASDVEEIVRNRRPWNPPSWD